MAVIVVPDTFRAMPRWWHDEAGRDWLEALPSLVADQCQGWGLDVDGEPWHGSNALVVPVRRGTVPWALRLAPPGDDVDAEATALRFWDGRGTVRLAEADVAGRALLLERLDGSRSLTSEPLSVAIPVIAELVGVLAVPAPESARSTAAVAAEHAAGFEADWVRLGRPTPQQHLGAAVGLAAELAAVPPPNDANDAVDGDLHGDQILAAERAPWLVVDPVLLRGDPEYDVARVLWSRLDELPDDADVYAAVELFTRASGLPRERVRAWIVVRSMSYLLWGLAHGLTWDPPKVRRLLDLFC